MGKSTLNVINADEEVIRNLALELGCEVGSRPMKYLGPPLCGNPLSREFWNPVVEKVSKRLSLGKRLLILRGVNSWQASLFILSLFKLPTAVAK